MDRIGNMTEQIWKYHTPQYDGHAPDDWAEGLEVECGVNNTWRLKCAANVLWAEGLLYRYRPTQNAKQEDLLAQCLALPQADREALIEALQKPQRDWADDVWDAANKAYLSNNSYQSGETSHEKAAAVIRSMCRPKEVEIDAEELFFDIIEESGYDARVREGGLDDKDKAAIRLIREALS